MPHPEGHQRGPYTSGDTLGLHRRMGLVQGMPHPEGHRTGPCTSGVTLGVHTRMGLVHGVRATKRAPAPPVPLPVISEARGTPHPEGHQRVPCHGSAARTV